MPYGAGGEGMSIIILIVGGLMIGLGLWQPIKNHFAKKRGDILPPINVNDDTSDTSATSWMGMDILDANNPFWVDPSDDS